MKFNLRRTALAVAVMAVGGSVSWAAGLWSTLPIIGGSSFCASFVTGSAGQICGQTVPAGPPFLTGAELIPADTGLAGGASPSTAMIPSPALYNRVNWLIGTDFGQNLWQRGTTPISAALITSASMSADGWYVYSAGPETITAAKQTAVADQPPASGASMRLQRVAAQTGTGLICTGQLVPDDSSTSFIGRTAVFSVDMLAGANFSATGSNVSMVIAYHTVADAAASANGQGTNTGTFASSVGVTQNITNYTEVVATLTPITTTWTRYSVAAAIPATTAAGTAVLGVGVKLCYTPVGTAGTNDWFEFGKAQLESRAGSSISPSPYVANSLTAEWQLEYARYFQINEATTGTPIYGQGAIGLTNVEITAIPFPNAMRIVPTSTPITLGSFELVVAGVPLSPSTATVTTNTLTNAGFRSTANGTSGQAVYWTQGGLGTGRLGFSAEP